jgi:pseudouridylate synthase
MKLERLFELSPDFASALSGHKPIVAFESAIITHGLPYPENYNLICELQDQALGQGVYLAVLWLDRGKIRVGISSQELRLLSQSENSCKVTTQDLPICLSSGKSGGTTVGASIFIANKVGLEVFCTGGIGGVHYGVNDSFDISHDLFALSQTPIITISAGVKAILDIGKTLELLETLGVFVGGYQTDRLPCFYTRDSEYPVHRFDSVSEICRVWIQHRELRLKSAMLITNPVPEEYSIAQEIVVKAVKEGLEALKNEGIQGKDVTPYLLAKLSELPYLDSVGTNISLAKNNLELACKIAKELSAGPVAI